jgi:hypothetical protein
VASAVTTHDVVTEVNCKEAPRPEIGSRRVSPAGWLVRCGRCVSIRFNSHTRPFYGVGAGDSPGDGEGASTDPSVFGGFRFAALCFCDGVGVGLAAAGAVAVVPCCCVQETTNATPIKALIKNTIYFFIGCKFQFAYRGMFGCLPALALATKARTIYLRAALPGPSCTGEGLCRHATEQFWCRVGIGPR